MTISIFFSACVVNSENRIRMTYSPGRILWSNSAGAEIRLPFGGELLAQSNSSSLGMSFCTIGSYLLFLDSGLIDLSEENEVSFDDSFDELLEEEGYALLRGLDPEFIN